MALMIRSVYYHYLKVAKSLAEKNRQVSEDRKLAPGWYKHAIRSIVDHL